MQDLREIRLLSIKIIFDAIKDKYQLTDTNAMLKQAEKVSNYIERGKLPESLTEGANYPG